MTDNKHQIQEILTIEEYKSLFGDELPAGILMTGRYVPVRLIRFPHTNNVVFADYDHFTYISRDEAAGRTSTMRTLFTKLPDITIGHLANLNEADVVRTLMKGDHSVIVSYSDQREVKVKDYKAHVPTRGRRRI